MSVFSLAVRARGPSDGVAALCTTNPVFMNGTLRRDRTRVLIAMHGGQPGDRVVKPAMRAGHDDHILCRRIRIDVLLHVSR